MSGVRQTLDITLAIDTTPIPLDLARAERSNLLPRSFQVQLALPYGTSSRPPLGNHCLITVGARAQKKLRVIHVIGQESVLQLTSQVQGSVSLQAPTAILSPFSGRGIHFSPT